eukprot:scaffold306_cov525-Prasinococcus_capsulatus_cf.AAC.23
MDLREECIALQLPSANNNTCPPNLLGICPDDCVTICGTPEDDIIYATPSGTYEVCRAAFLSDLLCAFDEVSRVPNAWIRSTSHWRTPRAIVCLAGPVLTQYMAATLVTPYTARAALT